MTTSDRATGRPAPTRAPFGTDDPPRTRKATARGLLRLLRPGQWVKNAAVVPVVLLAAPVWSLGLLADVGWSVLVFTLVSAVVYVGNDVVDRDRDRLHPVKRDRPVAAGAVSVPAACALGALLIAAAAVLLVARPPGE